MLIRKPVGHRNIWISQAFLSHLWGEWIWHENYYSTLFTSFFPWYYSALTISVDRVTDNDGTYIYLFTLLWKMIADKTMPWKKLWCQKWDLFYEILFYTEHSWEIIDIYNNKNSQNIPGFNMSATDIKKENYTRFILVQVHPVLFYHDVVPLAVLSTATW